mmetsp:Transcript_118/g.389  ORF Transcript_118/g.389 Transcript_118/m.389 type:complete len:282 (-) Transcript_118:13-858(-)
MKRRSRRPATAATLVLALLLGAPAWGRAADGAQEGTCEERNHELAQRVQRLERLFNESHLEIDLENASHLEIMWHSLREWALNAVPPTDPECVFDYGVGRCSPKCRCLLRPQPGDYTLSRACRLAPRERWTDPQCLALSDDPWVQRAWRGARHAAQGALRFVQAHAPESDEECTFDWRNLRCSPADRCELQLQLGDYSPHRACRRRMLAVGVDAGTASPGTAGLVGSGASSHPAAAVATGAVAAAVSVAAGEDGDGSELTPAELYDEELLSGMAYAAQAPP